MNRNRLLALLITALFCAHLLIEAFTTLASSDVSTTEVLNAAPAVRAIAPRVVESFRATSADGAVAKQRPAWVNEIHRTTLDQIAMRPRAFGVASTDDLELFGVDRDDRGSTDVRLSLRHGGVAVVGGQLIVRLDAQSRISGLSGHAFDVAGTNVTPQIDEAAAIQIASSVAGRLDGMTVSSQLVVVPNALVRDDDSVRGGTLAFMVKFSSSDITRGMKVFVDARTGSIVWRFATAPHASGIGYGEYNGRVTIITEEYEDGKYKMIDASAGNSEVHDANNEEGDLDSDIFLNANANIWGDGTPMNRDTAAVDASFNVNETWRYYRDRHGRLGADGNGTKIKTFVHYGSGYNNASGGDNVIVLGDGDGMTWGSFASMDTVAHEFTHSVVQSSTGIAYSGEGGALDEALADIFATAVEFRSGRNPDYLIGEDDVRPVGSRIGVRDMANPDVAHVSQKVNAGGCVPEFDAAGEPTNDYCGVHTNSGLVNNVFYLLAEGGTNSVSGIAVPKIGREVAEDIFYEAMTRHMFAGTNFFRMAHAMLSASTDLYGYNSKVYKAVLKAWQAVGVLEGKRPAVDFTTWKTLSYASYDGSAQTGLINPVYGYDALTNYGAGSFAPNWHVIVRLGTDIFYYNYDTGLAAIGHIDGNGNHVTTRVFNPGFFGRNWTHIVAHEGNVFFYNEATGRVAMGRFTGPNGFTQYGASGGFSLYWTHIVSAQGRLLFYNQNNGIGAVGVLDEVYGAADGLFRTLTEVRFRQLRPAQYLATEWSHIVDTKDGVLFYSMATGAYVVVDIDDGGTLVDRQPETSPSGRPMWSYSSLGERFTHVERVKDALLFYDTNGGYAMTVTMYTPPASRRLLWGKHEPAVVEQRFAMPGGWTHIVGAIDEDPF